MLGHEAVVCARSRLRRIRSHESCAFRGVLRRSAAVCRPVGAAASAVADRLRGLRKPAQRAEAVKLLDFLGMSQRQVILAVIVGVLLAAVLMWLAPDLIVR